MTSEKTLSIPARPVSFGDTRALLERSSAKATELRDRGLAETAELITKMVERSLRQERLLHEERDRSHDLEMKLTIALADERARALDPHIATC